MIPILWAAVLLQDPDPAKDLEKELDRIVAACAATEEKFSVGAAGECIQQMRAAVGAAERAGDAKSQAPFAAMVIDRICKVVAALDTRSPELRRLQSQLERGRKRAAAAADDAKKTSALLYALDRASLIVSSVSNEAVELANLGMDSMRRGEWEEAEDALAEAESKMPALRASTWDATAQAPRMASLLLSRARAAQGKIKEAADDLRRGVERIPEWLDRDMAFKDVLHSKPEEWTKLVKSLEARGDDPDALLLLGHEKYFSEERAKSKDLFERVLKKRPGDPAALKFLEKLKP